MEHDLVPIPWNGVTAFCAIAFAWWAGCDKAVFVGLDLSTDKGHYVGTVPYTERGASRGYENQIKSLSQARYPGLTVYNTSPYSQDRLPFKKLDINTLK